MKNNLDDIYIILNTQSLLSHLHILREVLHTAHRKQHCTHAHTQAWTHVSFFKNRTVLQKTLQVIYLKSPEALRGRQVRGLVRGGLLKQDVNEVEGGRLTLKLFYASQWLLASQKAGNGEVSIFHCSLRRMTAWK